MKSFPFVVCLIVGLWVGYMFGINKPADSLTPENLPTAAQAESAASELASLRAKNLELSQRIEALEKELAVLTTAK